ncbi:MAG: uroporphyrinogen decarboxylase family protein [bacterium]
MNSKKRVLTALNWREPDRVPVQIYLTPEIKSKLIEHFNGKDILDALGVDFRHVSPKYRGKLRESYDGITYDMWGSGYKHIKHGSAGTYDEAVVLPLAELKTMDDVENYPWPTPDDFDYSVIPEQCERFHNFAICLGGGGYPDIVNGVSRGRGMEQVLIDIALRDDVGMAIINKRVDICYEVLRRGLEAANDKVDILCLGEDTGNQNGRMVSPKDFDEVFRPRLKRFYNLAHEFEAKAMMHSCGDTHEIMPTFIEMELDILDAMQPEPAGMDPETIRNACKGKLAFCGLISTQQTLPHGSIEDCRAEARHRLDVIAKGGGYIFSPAHCIQPDTPLENILAIYEEALAKKLI